MVDPAIVMMAGAGAKGTVVGLIKGAVGGIAGGGLVGISDDMIALGLGWYLRGKTKGMTRDFVTGIMIAGGAGLAEGVFSGLPLGGAMKTVTAPAKAAQTADESLTAFVSAQ